MWKAIVRKIVFALLYEFMDQWIKKKLPGILHELREQHPGLDNIVLDACEGLRDDIRSH